MKKPRLALLLEKEASKAFKRTRMMAIRFDDQLAQLTLMESVYGIAKVLEDFEIWAKTADKGIRYPMSEYLKVVDERLGQVVTEEEDPHVTEISKIVYELTNDIAPKGIIKRLLERYPVEDVEFAFRDFTSTMDDKELKTAIKKFFQDGGADAVIQKLQND